METRDKIDFLWKIITRYDYYYGTLNTKATVLLAFNVFVFTGIITKYAEFLPDYNQHTTIFIISAIILIITALSSIVSTWFTLKVLNPYLKSHVEPTKYLSNIFFGHVCQHEKPENYIDLMSNLEETNAHEDLCKQAHSLANGINNKFENIKIGIIIVLSVTLPAIFLLTVMKLIISNLK